MIYLSKIVTYLSSGIRWTAIKLFYLCVGIESLFQLGRFRLVRMVIAVASRKLKRGGRVISVGAHQMLLDEKDALGLSLNGVHEPDETKLLMSLIKPNDVVVDIGANIGYYTLIFAQAVGPTGHVYAFEPEPNNFKLLEKNIALNGYSNVTLIAKAIGDEDKKTNLFLSGRTGDHRMFDSHDGRSAVEVEVKSLDSYFAEATPRIAVIKMDIQGSEGHALAGMTKTLQNNPTVKIAMEFWPEGLSLAGTDPLALLQLLEEKGFWLYPLINQRNFFFSKKRKTLVRTTPIDFIQMGGGDLICSRGRLFQ